MKNLEKHFSDFDVIQKDSKIEISKNGYMLISLYRKGGAKADNFEVKLKFLRGFGGSRRTNMENKERIVFLEMLKCYSFEIEDRLDMEQNIPTFNNITSEEFVKFSKQMKLRLLMEDCLKFDGVFENYEIGTVEKDGKTCYFRSNIPNEVQIVGEAFKSNAYKKKGMTFEKGDVVLDLGANIGCFFLDIYDKVEQVIAVEPGNVNCKIARMNIKKNRIKNVVLLESAVVADDSKTIKLNCGLIPGAYSVKQNSAERQSIEVKCDNINDLIKTYKPNKIKFDIKGVETDCVRAIKKKYWKSIEQVSFDYCFDINGDLKNDYKEFNEMKDTLEQNGFDISPFEIDLKKNWNLVFCISKK
jgi:FkbM family methyltransferase